MLFNRKIFAAVFAAYVFLSPAATNAESTAQNLNDVVNSDAVAILNDAENLNDVEKTSTQVNLAVGQPPYESRKKRRTVYEPSTPPNENVQPSYPWQEPNPSPYPWQDPEPSYPWQDENPEPSYPWQDEPSTPNENPTPSNEPPATPRQEGEGLEFLVYNQNGVMAFALIAAHENYKVVPVLANNQIKGRETLSQITGGYSNDVAMIDANYFERDGSIAGILEINDVIVGRGDYKRSAIGINPDGSIVFGQVSYYGEVILNGENYTINGVNCERPANSIILYNNHYGTSTDTNDSGIEITVRNNVVTNIQRGKGNSPIPYDGFVISAHGNAVNNFANVGVGDSLYVQEMAIDDNGNFDNAIHIIGAGPRLVMGGQVYVTADEENFPSDIRVGRAPRAAFGVTIYGDYIFAVVDGRQSHSRGCTLYEWAEILVNQFGAVDAINLDGGGSAELIVHDSVVNSPSDGKERPVASALMIVPR
ncbi:MAG: phosphodiester glycosidase family protein [Selenomonadaceae bacterium]|nr:phosphodiester glycosidase family protein [Selenomonadaceae bacterium]